jgi:surface antigen
MENNLNQQNLAISAMPQWQVAQSSSPFLAGIQGGLQGLSMGMGLMQGQQSLNLAQQQAALNGTSTM